MLITLTFDETEYLFTILLFTVLITLTTLPLFINVWLLKYYGFAVLSHLLSTGYLFYFLLAYL